MATLTIVASTRSITAASSITPSAAQRRGSGGFMRGLLGGSADCRTAFDSNGVRRVEHRSTDVKSNLAMAEPDNTSWDRGAAAPADRRGGRRERPPITREAIVDVAMDV